MRADQQLEPEAGTEGLSREAGGAAVPPPSAAAVLTKRTLMSAGWLEVVPSLCRSQFNPIGGGQTRHHYRERLEALAASFYRGVLITLTLDRAKFADAAEGYRVTRPRVCDAMREALGDGAVWAGVVEFQSSTGEGWPHYHIVGELREGVTLSKVRCAIRESWADRWRLGRCIDVELVKNRLATARYLGGYLSKSASAIPHWVLNRERSPRMFGSSWAAGQRLLTLGVRRSPTNKHSRREETIQRMRELRAARAAARVKSTLLERLARSGTCCKVRAVSVSPIGELRFVWLNRLVQAPFVDVAQVADHAVERRAEFRLGGGLDCLASALEDQFGERVEAAVRQRTDELLAAWDSS